MIRRHSLYSTALAAGLALSLVACSGGSDKAGAPTSSTTTSSTPPPTTPSATPTVTQSTPVPAPKPRTAAELTKALLALPDLPSGFSVDPDDDDDGPRMTSTAPRCARLVSLFNAKTSPGAKVSVHRLFSGGQQGPYVEETLDWMGSATATAALLTTTRAAIQACKQAKLRIPGAGTSTVAIAEVAAPKAGTTPVAVRITATSGQAEGTEMIFLLTGVDDVLLGISVDDAASLEDATADAVAKATKVLGTAKSGT
jgi:hypothetical protein